MSTADFVLRQAPADPRQRELWLQHIAGLIIWEDVRAYALKRIDPALGDDAKAAATKAVNDAVYGLMMVVDGETGTVRSAERAAFLNVSVRYEFSGQTEIFDLSEGDGMCMGYHGWMDGDFGDAAVAAPRSK
jgi:hypothetical protein